MLLVVVVIDEEIMAGANIKQCKEKLMAVDIGESGVGSFQVSG